MKSYEIKKIEPGSVFKLYFLLGVVFGLLASIILVIAGATLKNIGLELGTFGASGPLQAGTAIIGVVLASLAYGLMAGVISTIGAIIYNVFAAAIGGIVVKLDDR